MSHFMAEYYQGDVLIIEVVNNDPAKWRMYVLHVGPEPLAHPVITLTLLDEQHNGKPDLIIQIEGQEVTYRLYNDGTNFQTAAPGGK
jgi:hypothetical protein